MIFEGFFYESLGIQNDHPLWLSESSMVVQLQQQTELGILQKASAAHDHFGSPTLGNKPQCIKLITTFLGRNKFKLKVGRVDKPSQKRQVFVEAPDVGSPALRFAPAKVCGSDMVVSPLASSSHEGWGPPRGGVKAMVSHNDHGLSRLMIHWVADPAINCDSV